MIATKFPEIYLSIAKLAATNEALAAAALDDLMLRDPKKRLAATLLRLTGLRWDFQGNPVLNPIPVMIVELSEAANLSRSVTAKKMSELSKEGAVKKGYKSVHVTRPDYLRSLLEG
ncbi:helix-turn-helix domain-containing protein [Ruegeria profundi]|uniref:helix-turn-helix domain-containing protein n=1 Tax=Ruegeria profundi TaxID=1685378 RepID=UPI001CD430FB|nr:helix-turn-helix domain-containing protein [Ruegeria profundi]MCA0930754.1 helix-turn-helix domain-containing protein [Ruegeria profundi]